MDILLLPNYVNGTYEYIATWTSKHYIQQWMPCNIVPTIKTNGCSIYVNRILCPLIYLFGHIHLGLFWQIYSQSMVWWGFVIGSRFGCCFHNFYERWVSHNIGWDVCLIKECCPFLVQILFFGWIQSLRQWNMLKVQVLLFVDILRPYVLFVKGVKFWALSTWNLEIDYTSTKGFSFSMATFSVRPSEIWASTSMSFNGGGTSLPH
jgi:hypothetical protein